MAEPARSPMMADSDPMAAPKATSTLGTWERVTFTVAHTAAAGILRLFSLRGLYAFGRILGSMEWAINYKRRRRFVRAYTRLVVDPPSRREIRQATRDHFCQSRCDKLLYLVFDCIPRSVASSLLKIDDEAAIKSALAKGNGLYIAMSHHGPHHVMSMLLIASGYAVVGVRDRREGGLRRYVMDHLERHLPPESKQRYLFSDSFPREIFRCFQDGLVVGSAMDIGRLRGVSQKVEEVTIFGERRPFLSGPLRVALRCRAPVVQGFIESEPGFRYRLKTVWLSTVSNPADDKPATISRLMQEYATNVEKQMQETPALISRL